MSLDATLTDERVLTAGSGITIVDGGANGPVTINADAGGATISAEYRFQTSIVEADPGNGNFRMDNATPASVTELFISSTDDNNNDFDNFLSFIDAGAQVYIQQDNDSTKFILLDVTATVDNTGWWSIAGTIAASGTIFDSNAKCTILLLYQGTGANGDVFKVGTPVDNQIGVWTGDGTIEGDVNFTYGDNPEQMMVQVVTNTVNDVGILIIDSDSVLNPLGWGLIPGQAGQHDGTLLITSNPGATVTARVLTLLPAPNSSVVAAGAGFAVADGSGFRSETLGALTFYIPRQTSGVDRAWFSFTGDTAGGSGSRLQFDSYNFGDSGLQLTPSIVAFVVDADYRPHVDFDATLLFLNAGGLEAGEDGITANAVTGLQIQGQGSVNDVTIYNDAHVAVIEIPTGGTLVEFAGNIRPAGTVEWDKGADIASAATLVLGSDGNSFDVTGTTTIDAVSAKPIGTVIVLTFDDAVTLTYDATALDLSGDVDMVTEADDTLGLHCYDGTNWRELFRTDGQNVRASGNIDDQAMVRGNGGAKRIQDTGNLIGDDDEIVMAGFIQFQTFTDTELNDITDSVNTTGAKVQGAQAYNSTQDVPVWAVGAADGDVWVDGAGTTVNTPV